MHLTVQLCQVLPESWGNASWEPAGIQRHSCGCTFTIFNLLIGWWLLRKIWTGFLPPLLYLHTFYWMYILGTQLMNVRRCLYKKDACTSEHSYVIICNTLGKLGWFLSFVKHVILYEKKNSFKCTVFSRFHRLLFIACSGISFWKSKKKEKREFLILSSMC